MIGKFKKKNSQVNPESECHGLSNPGITDFKAITTNEASYRTMFTYVNRYPGMQ